MKVRVIYKHWLTGKELETIGTIRWNNPGSDRLIVEQDNGSFEDILKRTIIRTEELNDR